MTTQRPAGWRRPRGLRHRVAGLLVALLAAGGVWLVWHAAIDTSALRFVDVLSLDGAGVEGTGSTWGTYLWAFAEPVVTVVSKKVIFGVLVVACGLAVYRKRVVLAVQLVLLVGGANLTSQYLKSHVTRPDVGLGDTLYNSWTSGHTTAAASMSVALVLAVPRRFRPVAVVIGVLYTTTTGVGTMIGSWHRPSDVLGGLLVVLAWTGLVTALDGTLETGPATRASTTTVALLTGSAMATGAAAWVAIDRTLGLGVVLTEPSRADRLVAFGGGALAVVAVTCLVFACLTGLLGLADRDTAVSVTLPTQA